MSTNELHTPLKNQKARSVVREPEPDGDGGHVPLPPCTQTDASRHHRDGKPAGRPSAVAQAALDNAGKPKAAPLTEEECNARWEQEKEEQFQQDVVRIKAENAARKARRAKKNGSADPEPDTGKDERTGQDIVDAVGKLVDEGRLDGDITPSVWHHRILNRHKGRGEPYWLAIALLAVIVGWHRPDRKGRKKFRGDMLQLTIGWLCERLNACDSAVRKALCFLEEEVGVIKRVHHYTGYRKNLYIKLVPEVLKTLSTIDKEPIGALSTNDSDNPPLPVSQDRKHRSYKTGSTVLTETEAPFSQERKHRSCDTGTITGTGNKKDKKTTTTKAASRAGAAAPCTPSSSSSSLSLSLLELSAAEVNALPVVARRVVKFVQAFRVVFDVRFNEDGVAGEPEMEALSRLFENDNRWWSVGLLYLLVLAWGRLGASKKNANGEVYRYAACQNSRKILHVLKNLEGIMRDTNTTESGLQRLDPEAAIGCIRSELENQLEGQVDPEELETMLADMEDKLADIVAVKPAPEKEEGDPEQAGDDEPENNDREAAGGAPEEEHE